MFVCFLYKILFKYKNPKFNYIQINLYKNFFFIKKKTNKFFLYKPKLINYGLLNFYKKNFFFIKKIQNLNLNFLNTTLNLNLDINENFINLFNLKKFKNFFEILIWNDLFFKKKIHEYLNYGIELIWIFNLNFLFFKKVKNKFFIFKKYRQFDIYIHIKINFIFFKKFYFKKKSKINFKNNLILLNQNNHKNFFFSKNLNGVSNKYLMYFSFCLLNLRLTKSYSKYFNNSYFTNLYPFFLNKNYVFIKLFREFKRRKTIDTTQIFDLFLVRMLEKILLKKVFVKYITNNTIKNELEMQQHLINCNKFFKNVLCKYFKVNEFFDVLMYSISLKESKLFIEYLLMIYELLPEKIHQKFTLSLKNVFYQNTEIFITKYKIKGIYFDYKGKIGAINNAKKKRVLYAYGFPKFGSKHIKIDYQYRTVETLGGTLGLTFVISY